MRMSNSSLSLLLLALFASFSTSFSRSISDEWFETNKLDDGSRNYKLGLRLLLQSDTPSPPPPTDDYAEAPTSDTSAGNNADGPTSNTTSSGNNADGPTSNTTSSGNNADGPTSNTTSAGNNADGPTSNTSAGNNADGPTSNTSAGNNADGPTSNTTSAGNNADGPTSHTRPGTHTSPGTPTSGGKGTTNDSPNGSSGSTPTAPSPPASGGGNKLTIILGISVPTSIIFTTILGILGRRCYKTRKSVRAGTTRHSNGSYVTPEAHGKDVVVEVAVNFGGAAKK